MIRAVALSLSLAVAAFSAQAESDATVIARQAAEMLEQAGFALLEADGARDRVEALTQTVRAYEEGLAALRSGVRQAALQERRILRRFETERERLARLLGVLQTLERAPQPLVLLHPQGPLGTVQSGLIISDVTPAVIREAQALRAELDTLATMRAIQDEAVAQLSTALDRAQEARTQLSQAIADRRDLPQNFTSDAVAMEELLASVVSLDQFAIGLSATAIANVDLPDFDSARGVLPLPVRGSLLRRFNEADAAGVARPGVVYATRPDALVSAPWAATVRYAGPLLDYGNVIILEPDDAFLLVLAGLGPIYVETGVFVLAEAPLGLMPGRASPSGGSLLANLSESGGADLSETLYIEVREDGRPIDPMVWFDLGGAGRD